MIEPIMYAGIGFLVAGLLVIGLIPLVHARAVRLTMKRLEAMTPMSMAEIQADKDQLRAEFAMSTRRLEMSVEQLKAKTTNQLAEIGKKSDGMTRLKLELGDKSTAFLELEAQHQQLSDELASTREQLVNTTSELEQTQRVLAESQNEGAKLNTILTETSLSGDSHRIEVVTLRTQLEMLKEQVSGSTRETNDLRARLAEASLELDAATQNLLEERARLDPLTNHIEELERLLVAQNTETEISGRRVAELTARLDEQGRFLADHEHTVGLLRNEAGTARQTEADVRAALAEAEQRRQQHTESLQSERAALEAQLAQSQEERGKLEREIVRMKRDAEATWASERMENAVLRERINDVAAEVAHLTSTLEGPGSAIGGILASDATRLHTGNGNGEHLFVPSGDNSETTRGSLADRIRALQNRASRLGQAS